jgi:hypothetical protein
MTNKACLHAVESLLRCLCDPNRPFGGKLFVGVGDFRQVAPVVKGGGLAAVIDASIRSSTLWQHFSIYKLEQPMRNATDPEYCAYVDAIGEDSDGFSTIQIRYLDHIYDVDTAIQWLYPQQILDNPMACVKRSFLSTLNEKVDEFNASILERLPAQKG